MLPKALGAAAFSARILYANVFRCFAPLYPRLAKTTSFERVLLPLEMTGRFFYAAVAIATIVAVKPPKSLVCGRMGRANCAFPARCQILDAPRKQAYVADFVYQRPITDLQSLCSPAPIPLVGLQGF